MKTHNDTIALKQKVTRALETLPNPSMVLKNKSATVDLFNKTARQGDVFAAIQNYKDGICRTKIKLTGDQTEFHTQVLEELDVRSLMRACMSARDYGYAVLEITEYTQVQGKTVPKKLELAPAEMFGFNGKRELLMFSQQHPRGLKIQEAFPNKFIVLQHEPTMLNPYGIGLLDVAYWYAVGLQGNFEFMLSYAEDDGRDKLIGKYSPDASIETQNKLFNGLVQARSGAVGIIPENTSVDKLENKNRSGSNDLYKMIDEMLRRKIDKLWFGTDLTMQVQGKGGYSSAQSGLELRDEALEDGAELVKSALKQVFGFVEHINNVVLPAVEIGLEAPKQRTKEQAEIDQIYSNTGVKFNKDFFVAKGYNPDHFEVQEPQPAESTQFSADFGLNEDEEGLVSAFDYYKSKLKKKD